jgi:maltose/moltooligosaccharide transporter
MGFALSVQISALSWMLNTQYGLNIEEVGFVWAAGPLAGIFGQLIIGFISDDTWFWNGRRRPFILIGGVLAALMLLALPAIGALSSWSGLGLLWVAVMVALTLDLAINISFNPTRSIIADVTPEGEARTQGYTWMQTISGMFGVLAYVIGATLGNYVLIYTGAALVLLFSVVPVFFITEPRYLNDGKSEEPSQASPGQTQLGELFKIYFAHGFTWLGVQTMFVFIFAYIKTEMGGMSDEQVGQVIAIAFAVLNTVGFLLPAPVLQPLAQRIGRVRTHTLCMFIMGIAYLLIVLLGKSTMVLYGLMALAGVGWAATVSLPFAIMSEKVAKERMGLFMGIFNLSVVIPQLIVSAFFGFLITTSGSNNTVFVISAVSLGFSALLWTTVRDSR